MFFISCNCVASIVFWFLHALASEYWAKDESCQPRMKYQARRQNKEVLIVTDVPLLQLFFSPFSSQSLSVSNLFFPTINTIHLYTKMPFCPPILVILFDTLEVCSNPQILNQYKTIKIMFDLTEFIKRLLQILKRYNWICASLVTSIFFRFLSDQLKWILLFPA